MPRLHRLHLGVNVRLSRCRENQHRILPAGRSMSVYAREPRLHCYPFLSALIMSYAAVKHGSIHVPVHFVFTEMGCWNSTRQQVENCTGNQRPEKSTESMGQLFSSCCTSQQGSETTGSCGRSLGPRKKKMRFSISRVFLLKVATLPTSSTITYAIVSLVCRGRSA